MEEVIVYIIIYNICIDIDIDIDVDIDILHTIFQSTDDKLVVLRNIYRSIFLKDVWNDESE